jgi:hypothetical protein
MPVSGNASNDLEESVSTPSATIVTGLLHQVERLFEVYRVRLA